jgi:hypothetical protein
MMAYIWRCEYIDVLLLKKFIINYRCLYLQDRYMYIYYNTDGAIKLQIYALE